FTCFFFKAEDGIRDVHVTGVQTCALPISAQFGLVHVVEAGRREKALRHALAGSANLQDGVELPLGLVEDGVERDLDLAAAGNVKIGRASWREREKQKYVSIYSQAN